ncbi:uncharacterized protein PG998_004567 [Apiospora kogelbergensis]|uniref:uncharacterized protein n=1 Tax=Apiospora kogelbergensis TaxID=1337665 RepID=UPI00312E77D4
MKQHSRPEATDMTTPRCKLCRNLTRDDDPSYTRLALDFSPNQLTSSVESTQCPHCVLLLEGIMVFESSFGVFSTNVRRVLAYGLSDADPDATLHLELYFYDERPRLSLEIFHYDPTPQRASENGVITSPDNSRLCCSSAIKTRSFVNLNLSSSSRWTKSHIHNCIRNHKTCVQLETVNFPRRLLVFYCDPGNETTTVKLEQDVDRPHERYATLSHCWGSHQTLVTTSKDIDERIQDIPWDIIPKTFQQSIQICLELGINYLWIDALCIIQDDQEDWEVESAKMADIYESSHFTIAATRANNDATGLFSQKNPGALASPLRATLSGPSYFSTTYVRQKLPHVIDRSHTVADAAPLLSRGWVFQERLLARRVIHFCETELIWECRHVTACYLAGLWANTIGYDILWRVDKLEDGAVVPTTYRGPSWSWVCVTSPVKYWDMADLKVHLELPTWSEAYDRNSGDSEVYAIVNGSILSVKPQVVNPGRIPWRGAVDLKGRNPFGEVTNGRLGIKNGSLSIATVEYAYDRRGETQAMEENQFSAGNNELARSQTAIKQSQGAEEEPPEEGSGANSDRGSYASWSIVLTP